MSAIVLLLVLSLIYCCAVGLTVTATLAPSSVANSMLVTCLVLGILALPVQTFGFVGNWRESKRLLKQYQLFAVVLGPIAMIVGGCTLGVSSSTLREYVNDNCHAITQRLPASFLADLPPGFGCQK